MKINVELFKHHPAWSAVLYVAEELQKRGHIAYLAGGSVRDAILGQKPKDFDIATSAQPGEVEQIFENTVAVGKAFGVIVVLVEGTPIAGGPVQKFSFEVATFRSDGDYKDGRRPDSVQYSTPEKDSERRDFTINSLFYDLKTGEVIDFHNGVRDIDAHVIRAVGDAELRFGEDKLRMLRAVRFAGQLGFKIDPPTFAAVRKLSREINVVSPERITEELNKVWQTQDPLYSFVLIQQSGLADHVFRGFTFMKSEKWLKFYQLGLDQIAHDCDLGWRWIALCEALCRSSQKSSWAASSGGGGRSGNDAGCESASGYDSASASGTSNASANEILRVFSNYRLSKELMTSIDFCLRQYHEFERRDTDALLLLDHKNGPALLQLASLERKLLGDVKFYEDFVDRYRSLSGADGFLQAPLLNGRDIEALGMPKSPKVGELLKGVYKVQLEGFVADRDEALEWVKKAMTR